MKRGDVVAVRAAENSDTLLRCLVLAVDDQGKSILVRPEGQSWVMEIDLKVGLSLQGRFSLAN